MDSRNEKGLTLVEVLVGIGILAVLIFASVSLTTSALTTTRGNLDRQFATEKAISMLEELKSVAQNPAAGTTVRPDQRKHAGAERMALSASRLGHSYRRSKQRRRPARPRSGLPRRQERNATPGGSLQRRPNAGDHPSAVAGLRRLRP